MEKKRCLHSPSYLIFKKSRPRVEDAELLDVKGVYLDFCLVSLLAGIVFLHYHNILSNFWLNDDTQILKHAISYQPWEYFFSPRVWQELSAINFTPWITFSFDVDWMIFDLHPYGFYLHHLISLCILASIAYVVLRLWFSALFSFLGVLLFAMSPSVAETAQFLMERHYLEGLIFALLSLYFFVKAVRNIGARWTIVSAFFYLCACLSKEIYVPLIFLLLFLPEGYLRKRFQLMLPCLAVTLVYVLWRWIILERLWGGNGIPLTWQDARLFLPRAIGAMGGTGESGKMTWWFWLISASSLASLTTQVALNRKTLIIIILVSLLVFLPIIPVSPVMTPRFLWAVSFCWVVLHISVWDRLRKKANPFFVWSGVLWSLILLIGFFSASHVSTRRIMDIVYQQSKEGIFFFQKGTKADLLINPKSQWHYYDGLSWLRREIIHMTEGPTVLSDNAFLCLEDQLKSKYLYVWSFDSQRGDLISENLDGFITRFCNKDLLMTIRPNEPLSVAMEYRNNEARWKFGPYREGNYALLFGQTAEAVHPLPVQGRTPVYVNNSTILFRLRYSSPEGWITYSPLLHISIIKHKGSIEWKR